MSDWGHWAAPNHFSAYHGLMFLGPTEPRKVYCHTRLQHGVPLWQMTGPVADVCTQFLENMHLEAAMKTLHLPRLRQGHEVLAAFTPCSAGVLPSVVHI
jgi:hypothetical protein